MKKICIVLCLCLAALLVLPGCAGEKQLTRVRLSEVTHSVFYAPQYVAMSQGFFRQEGLEVELTNGGGADKVMTAVVSGQADMGLAGPEAAIYVMNQGKEDHPVIFAQLTKRDGSFLVGREPGPFSWEDVRGRTIIGGRAGGVPEMTLEYVLRQRGIEPQRDAVVDTSVQFNMMAGAFTGGNGDYVTLFEPTATEVEQAGKGYILCSIGQESGEIPYTAYFANRSYVEANPETVQGFVNAMAAIYVMNQGKEDHPVIFAQLTKRDGSFLVGREPGPFSWEDVRGRTIIGGRAGGVPEMTLEYVLRQRGIEPQRDAVVDTSVQFNMMAGAFTGGNGDYVTLFEPTATEVEQAGKGYILCSIGQESGEIPYTAYFANRSYVEANPETVQGFVNAMALAQQWVAEHTDRQVAEAICDQFPDTDLDVLERVCARHREIDAWNRTPVMEQQALERLETVMTQAGELTSDQWVDFDGLVDNRFAQKAAGQ